MLCSVYQSGGENMSDRAPEEFEDGKSSKDVPFDRELKNTRREVIKKKDVANAEASGKFSDIGFWGVVAGIGFVADWTFLGGFGTAMAALGGASWISHKSDERKAKKELEDLDRKLMELEELKALNPQLQPQPAPKAKEDFTKVSIDELRKKLEDVQKELDEIKNPKSGQLDKPKFGPPRL